MPDRPFIGPNGRPLAGPPREASYPERELIATGPARLASGELSPPELLAAISRIMRVIYQEAALPRTEPRMLELSTEADSIRAAIDRLGISGGAVMRQRLDRARPEDTALFAQVARLYQRWGLVERRDGRVDVRVGAAARIEQSIEWDPTNPIPVLLLAAYEDLAGFRSNAIERLSRWDRVNPENDAIDLARVRKQERVWTMEGDSLALVRAKELTSRIALRQGGWTAAAPWVHMQRSRLAFFSDSLEMAEREAQDALRLERSDHTTEVEARLMLGLCAARALDYPEASRQLDRALALSLQDRSLGELASWLSVPWDQWNVREREEYDRASDRVEQIARFWEETDPIWATPRVLENRVEYRRRIAESYFAFSDIHPITPGPLTEPARAVIRFGWPTRWEHLGTRDLPGAPQATLDFGVYQTWRFHYQILDNGADPLDVSANRLRSERTIQFQELPGTSRFHCPDSLTAPKWPERLFNFDFLGRGYHYHTQVSRFRDEEGGTELWIALDTELPNYAVRYPFQGLRYDGSAAVDLTLFREERARDRRDPDAAPDSTRIVRREGKRRWLAGPSRGFTLDREDVMRDNWEFRRRAAMTHLTQVAPGRVRVASLLTLRDARERVVALSADNGDTLTLRPFAPKDLDASDLMLLTSFGDSLPDQEERELRPGLTVYGTDLEQLNALPKASRLFLRGERIAYYFELYNLDLGGRDKPAVEFSTTIERLNDDGDPVYRVTFRGAGWRLDHRKVTQWNVARSLGVTDLEPGIYRLVVTVDAGSKSSALYRTAYFRVVESDDLVALYRWGELPRPMP
ncbi:MAG: hypothetical protein U0527_03760 [Candidatus Eisenbacteria bacterium]